MTKDEQEKRYEEISETVKNLSNHEKMFAMWCMMDTLRDYLNGDMQDISDGEWNRDKKLAYMKAHEMYKFTYDLEDYLREIIF